MSGEVASRRMRVQMIDRLLRALDEAGGAS
jgi:hypothetical protein